MTETKQWSVELTLAFASGGTGIPTNQVISGTYTRSRDTVYFRDARDGQIIPAAFTDARISAQAFGLSYEFTRK